MSMKGPLTAREVWAGIALLGGAGLGLAAAVQQVLTVRDRRRFAPPGVLVDVHGHQMHLLISGPDGDGPAVILEAGMGSFSPNWYWVQRELSDIRTVAYDRPGLGWSEPTGRPRDARTIAEDLRQAMTAAGIEPPFVLAGHSFGGLPVRAFADVYPELTAGLVLVDASHPDQWARWPVRHADRILAASQRLLSVLAWFGMLRALDASRAISNGLPAEQVAQLRAASALPRCAATEAAQTKAWETSRNQLNAAAPLGELPLTVLAVTDQPVGGDLLTALQLELAGLTANARFEVVDGASHESLVSQRRHARRVAAAIRSVVQAAQDRQSSGSTTA
ncbi:alpha/beta fold hydrolase [Microbacterium sp.]|uniref:alpha/beta fold hydrolase n=1 Tax=Microbacterium sp. TaxID=51671 RepID=UPI002E34EB85|nr:alpha/beta fold hydrolase [Microbacterium sp.]HEX5730848.1 alpha/beta fold hydrolase [Microbacterium sp.]